MATEFHDSILEASLSKLVILDFYANWCVPCKNISPLVEDLAESKKSKLTVLKIDVDEFQDIAAFYNVTSIPTFILFRGGQELGRVAGRFEQLVQEVEKWIG